jgi:hypothetical protein
MDTGQTTTIGARHIPWIHAPGFGHASTALGTFHPWCDLTKPHGNGRYSGPGPKQDSGDVLLPSLPHDIY